MAEKKKRKKTSYFYVTAKGETGSMDAWRPSDVDIKLDGAVVIIALAELWHRVDKIPEEAVRFDKIRGKLIAGKTALCAYVEDPYKIEGLYMGLKNLDGCFFSKIKVGKSIVYVYNGAHSFFTLLEK